MPRDPIATYPWRRWFKEWVEDEIVSDEFRERLLMLFLKFRKKLWRGLWEPNAIQYEYKGHAVNVRPRMAWREPGWGHFEDAHSSVILGSLKALKQPRPNQLYDEGISDHGLFLYIQDIVWSECIKVCETQDPLWHNIQNHLKNHPGVIQIDAGAKLYVPTKWVHDALPSKLGDEELERCLETIKSSVPSFNILSREQIIGTAEQILSAIGTQIPIERLATKVLALHCTEAVGSDAFNERLQQVRSVITSSHRLTLVDRIDGSRVAREFLKNVLPKELQADEFESRISSVSLASESLGKLTEARLGAAIERIYTVVRSPITLADLTTAILKTFHAYWQQEQPADTGTVDQSDDLSGEDQYGVAITPSEVIKIDVRDCLEKSLKNPNLSYRHLLALQFRIIDGLGLVETAKMITEVSGPISKSSVENYIKEALTFISIPVGLIESDRMTYARTKFDMSWTPRSDSEVQVLKETFRECLAERLEELRLPTH